MDHVYPRGPAAVPPNLTAATSAYKQRAWLAMIGLTVFIVLYFALSGWFAWTSWRLFSVMFGAGGHFHLGAFAVAVCCGFLAVFMLKALFFIQHRYAIEDIEIKREDQPLLFDFIDRLADEARAPRAHKVYLSARVNAAVFYDLSLLNLIIPSKKNLEIGLGLINVLTLGELKAVLAHEFGHFAQRSMAVGRWVYISQQIAGHVVARRDALDRLLQQLSRFDLRIAWVGWILSIVVWSIRSLMDVLFRGVLLAQRALSRQMEFQADLVAVSLTGSDALVHALHKLQDADDAWDKALSFGNREAANKRGVRDLFAVQDRIIERMREILDRPMYCRAPPMPENARENHRVFKAELAQPPRMWVTHPPSTEREENAKRRYVAADIDQRSAWDLFRNPQAVKEQMSAHVFSEARLEAQPLETSLANLNKVYGRPFLDRAYRGVYLNRSPVRYAQNVDSLYAPVAPANLQATLAGLYPESLAKDVEQLNEKYGEKGALEALRDNVAQAPGGIIRHNGVQLRRKDLPRAIAGLDSEINVLRTRIETHDRTVRGAHLAAARELGNGWPEYLRGLATVLHYADHNAANLRDAQGYLANIWGVVTADGRVSEKEIARLIEGCQQLYRVIEPLYSKRNDIKLDRTLLRRLEVAQWSELLEELKLPPPNRDNISDWVNVIDGWINAALHALSRLREAALEQLLLAEGHAARFTREGIKGGSASPPSEVGAAYDTLLPGKERPLQKKLDWWDRFQVADGAVPMVARSAVAVGIVGSVIAIGGQVGSATMTIYNGLATQVAVQVAEQRVVVSPHRWQDITVPATGTLQIRTTAASGARQLIEEFEQPLSGSNADYVYNVAAATPLVEWTAVYTAEGNPNSSRKPPKDRNLGALRWTTSEVDYLFVEPPERLQMDKNSSRTSRTALSAPSKQEPWRQLGLLRDEKQKSQVVLTHARFDDLKAPLTAEWMQLAAQDPQFQDVLTERLRATPDDVQLMRLEQDSTTGDAHQAVCGRHRALAQKQAHVVNLQYVAIRCLEDEAEQDAAFIAAQQKWPDHPWLAMATAKALAETGEYERAQPMAEKAMNDLTALRPQLVLDVARLRRLNADREMPDLGGLVKHSDTLGMMTSIESGRGLDDTPLAPYAALARGDIAKAAKFARKLEDGRDRALRAVASSEGATADMIDDAFALPVNEDADFETTMAMYGLALRTQRDVAPYAALLRKQLGEQAPDVITFLDQLQSDRAPSAIHEELPQSDLRLRLHALHAAVILFGDAAPTAWRREVYRGLFVGERGYVRPL